MGATDTKRKEEGSGGVAIHGPHSNKRTVTLNRGRQDTSRGGVGWEMEKGRQT